MLLKDFKMMCLKLENFEFLTVDITKEIKKGRTDEDVRKSPDQRGKYETSFYDLDLDGSVVHDDTRKILIEESNRVPLCAPKNLDGLGLLEINLRSWISMRDLLKRECMALAPMIESVLVLSLFIPAFFLLCIAHEIYLRQDAWLTTFNSVAVLHIIVFLAFATDALLLCVDANAKFDSHNDKIAKNKESFLRRRKQTKAESQGDTNESIETYVKYLHISNVMDTMIQKIETKDVPITLLGVKVNRTLQSKALFAASSYLFTLVCIVAQRFDVVVELEESFVPKRL
jgi:hypothetical protein